MNEPTAPAGGAQSSDKRQAGLAVNLRQFWLYLIRGRVLNIALLLCLIALAALMEMATLAAAVPLIGSLIDSQFSSSNLIANNLKLPEFITSARKPHALVLAMAVVIVCVSAALRILVVRISTDFSARAGIALQVQCFRYLLNRDYEAVINESSSKSIGLIANKIQVVISVYILGVLNTLTAIVSALAVAAFLFWISDVVVFFAIGVLAFAYLFIAWATRSRLKRYGNDLQTYIPEKVQHVQEAFGGIRDVVMSGAQEVFTDKLRSAVEKVEKAVARVVFFGAFPRPIVEAIGISCVAGIALLAHQGYIKSDNLLPLLGVFSLGILRLMPFVQQIFAQWTRIVNGQAILSELMQLIRNMDVQNQQPANHGVDNDFAPMAFEHSIALDNVSFSYYDVNKPAIENISFSINKGEHIGVIGPTGSGKSTLVDILMGLLQPAAGSVLIDGVVLDKGNRVQWQKQVAHVPQKIFLTEGSIESNIAFAIAADNIDKARVSQCAKLACVEDFILSLPDQYATPVGENGVRLSGGQRQRIGIARALYSRCSVLVLDEATSALDEITERQVIEGLSDKKQGYTIVSITHNTALLDRCSRVLMVRDGQGRWRD